jgi:hypothetical protein
MIQTMAVSNERTNPIANATRTILAGENAYDIADNTAISAAIASAIPAYFRLLNRLEGCFELSLNIWTHVPVRTPARIASRDTSHHGNDLSQPMMAASTATTDAQVIGETTLQSERRSFILSERSRSIVASPRQSQ